MFVCIHGYMHYIHGYMDANVTMSPAKICPVTERVTCTGFTNPLTQ